MRFAGFVNIPAISFALIEVNCRQVRYGDMGDQFFAPPRQVDGTG
jgi:hypothetical protein